MREFVEKQARMENTFKKLEEMGISYNKNLPPRETSAEVNKRSIEEICARAKSCALMIHAASYISAKGDNEYVDTIRKTVEPLKRYLSEDELAIFNKKYSQLNLGAVTWNIEALYVLYWALGQGKNELMEKPYGQIKEKEIAIMLPFFVRPESEILNDCKLLDIEDILDMVVLYYNYDWVLVEKELAGRLSKIKKGKLSMDIVMERRKALEWLIESVDNWDDVRSDT